jgi:hypothetical protein
MMDYLLLSTAVAGTVLLVAFFLRSTRDACEDSREIGTGEGGGGDFWNGRVTSAALKGIFSGEDRQFISQEGDKQITSLFRRERKRLALRWIERQRYQSASIMRRHREASGRAADLRPSSEATLFLRYCQLNLLFEILAVSVWLVGPEGLHGLAESADAVLRGIENVKALGGSKRSISA